jgi:hypothetical protein
MSEMVKNSDVEDVLFSIRRLVSDNPEAKPAPSPSATGDAKAEALFLTSSLRVNDPATEPEQVDLEDMTTDLSHFRDAVSREDTEVAEMPSLEEFFADKSDDQSPRRLHLSEVVKDDATAAQDASEQMAPVKETYFEDEDTGDLVSRKWTDDPDVETLSDFATPGDTFGTPVQDEVEPVVEASETIAEDWMEDVAVDEAKLHEASKEATSDDFEDEIGLEIATENAVSDEDDLLAETEAKDDTPEPDVSTVEDVNDNSDDANLGAADGLANFDENILDEDALRDMVTEIVREELSGALGERITRNVRKLVRREIHRALMAREFD